MMKGEINCHNSAQKDKIWFSKNDQSLSMKKKHTSSSLHPELYNVSGFQNM